MAGPGLESKSSRGKEMPRHQLSLYFPPILGRVFRERTKELLPYTREKDWLVPRKLRHSVESGFLGSQMGLGVGGLVVEPAVPPI